MPVPHAPTAFVACHGASRGNNDWRWGCSPSPQPTGGSPYPPHPGRGNIPPRRAEPDGWPCSHHRNVRCVLALATSTASLLQTLLQTLLSPEPSPPKSSRHRTMRTVTKHPRTTCPKMLDWVDWEWYNHVLGTLLLADSSGVSAGGMSDAASPTRVHAD